MRISEAREQATDAFVPPRRVEIDFRRAIEKLLLKQLDIPPGSTIGEILERISEVIRHETSFEKLGLLFSRKMVSEVQVSNAKSWREAARKAGRGREIYAALQEEMEGNVGKRLRELVNENAQLISSIPAEIRESINREVAGLEQQGLRPNTIAEHLRRRVPELTRARAALIARTETSKAATALTQARSEDLGIECYQWKTAKDQRVRPAHRLLENVLVRWDDPPSPEALAHIESSLGHYNAGAAPNCRCVALPVVNLTLIQWPARVYDHGRIIRMTRNRFEGKRRAA